MHKKYLESKQNTNEWFLKNNSRDSVVSNKLRELHTIILILKDKI
jgi:hypothetical protein